MTTKPYHPMYYLIIFSVAGIFMFIRVMVLPNFLRMYEELGEELPTLTALMFQPVWVYPAVIAGWLILMLLLPGRVPIAIGLPLVLFTSGGYFLLLMLALYLPIFYLTSAQ